MIDDITKKCLDKSKRRKIFKGVNLKMKKEVDLYHELEIWLTEFIPYVEEFCRSAGVPAPNSGNDIDEITDINNERCWQDCSEINPECFLKNSSNN